MRSSSPPLIHSPNVHSGQGCARLQLGEPETQSVSLMWVAGINHLSHHLPLPGSLSAGRWGQELQPGVNPDTLIWDTSFLWGGRWGRLWGVRMCLNHKVKCMYYCVIPPSHLGLGWWYDKILRF